jgi:hypothetical protein
MTRTSCLVLAAAAAVVVSTGWVVAQPAGDPLIECFRTVEVASVSDAMEQLYGQRGYMSHGMRPLSPTKFACRSSRSTDRSRKR